MTEYEVTYRVIETKQYRNSVVVPAKSKREAIKRVKEACKTGKIPVDFSEVEWDIDGIADEEACGEVKYSEFGAEKYGE